jgi:hypothetical protein
VVGRAVYLFEGFAVEGEVEFLVVAVDLVIARALE